MIIYAVNIHTGGGKVLLDELIQNSVFGQVTYAFLDKRYTPPSTQHHLKTFYSANKILGRILSELNLHKLIRYLGCEKIENVMFFGNIPPFFKPKTHSILYLQNCFLTRQVPLPKDSFKEMIRNWIESILLKALSRNVDEIWVQTEWMKDATQKYLPNSKISLHPFLPTLKPQSISVQKKYKFLYVGSLALNKRLHFFLESLKFLDDKLDHEIQIAIILDNPTEFKHTLFSEKLKKIKIETFNQLSREELTTKYCESEYFVTTSKYESFCLPIYEANSCQCNVIVPIAGYTKNLPFKVTYYDDSIVHDLGEKLFQLC